ncbi:MAG TPA: hypothetical protein VNC84_02570 [Gammaproteobacteria bacterium]|nr:hypothetical protein [Gammaproteobacteria bacterium]
MASNRNTFRLLEGDYNVLSKLPYFATVMERDEKIKRDKGKSSHIKQIILDLSRDFTILQSKYREILDNIFYSDIKNYSQELLSGSHVISFITYFRVLYYNANCEMPVLNEFRYTYFDDNNQICAVSGAELVLGDQIICEAVEIIRNCTATEKEMKLSFLYSDNLNNLNLLNLDAETEVKKEFKKENKASIFHNAKSTFLSILRRKEIKNVESTFLSKLGCQEIESRLKNTAKNGSIFDFAGQIENDDNLFTTLSREKLDTYFESREREFSTKEREFKDNIKQENKKACHIGEKLSSDIDAILESEKFSDNEKVFFQQIYVHAAKLLDVNSTAEDRTNGIVKLNTLRKNILDKIKEGSQLDKKTMLLQALSASLAAFSVLALGAGITLLVLATPANSLVVYAMVLSCTTSCCATGSFFSYEGSKTTDSYKERVSRKPLLIKQSAVAHSLKLFNQNRKNNVRVKKAAERIRVR